MSSAKSLLESLVLEHDLEKSVGAQNVFSSPSICLVDLIKVIVDTPGRDFLEYLKILSKLISLAPQEWIKHYVSEITNTSSSAENLLEQLILKGCVPYVRDLQHRKCEKKDFFNMAEKAESVLEFIKSLLSKMSLDEESEEMKSVVSKALPYLLILVIEHQHPDLWTSSVSLVLSMEMLDKVKNVLAVNNNEELLQYKISKDQLSSVLFFILKHLNDKLRRDSWMCYPSLKVVYQWCLFHTKFPNMSEFFPKFLPTALLFIDDHVLENKILGVTCLYHIMQNTSREELRWYGQADVIYEALKHQLYTREAKLIDPLHPALLYILSVVEKDPQYCTDPQGLQRVPTKYDEIFHTILTDAYGEQNLTLRIALTGHLTYFVEKLGLLTLRHTNLLFRVIEEYLEVYDGKRHSAKPQILRLLKSVIIATWPRMPRYVDFILKILVKLLVDVSDKDKYDFELIHNIEELSTQCLILIKHVNLEYVERQLQSITKLDVPEACKRTLSDALQLSM
ncbi:TELO2-interacting protein 2-like [Saccostrea echinata]|uniref:TELO2-interacting protein 2-like n=1 Tax=Saccostrea echinata TaxID=191078 RepID=UPI002A836322|nr:TELO2-interacting protein 2-like [Saccostrea echinata]